VPVIVLSQSRYYRTVIPIVRPLRTDESLPVKPFLILETGQPVASLNRHGGFPHWIRVAAGLHAREVRSCNVAEGEALPNAADFSGVMITGSGAMVSERLDWSERSADWLRDAAHAGHPLFGICYGHQLLAHALGGSVDYNPRGREMGTVPVKLSEHANGDALFGNLPPSIDVHTTHMQSVLKLPAEATVLASSDLDDCQAFRWRNQVWGVQFHPEFSTVHMREYIHVRRMALLREGANPQAMRKAVGAAPHARQVLKRFVHHARKRG
jgi:GMP synthase (glutamine-hydrolysing)